jgi:hypothetical protein
MTQADSDIMNITRAHIQAATKSREVWALGNQVLYDLCRQYPTHTQDDVIIAKVLLIGRVYAAAIERRRVIVNQGDDFYTKTVAPKIRNSPIDTWLSALPPQPASDENATERILETHHNVTNLFSKISGLNKRSLASKYLHFHRPDLFFIYDSRAMTAIRLATPALRPRGTDGSDPGYSSFFRRCQRLTEDIRNKLGTDLNPRQLDDVLISIP